LSILCFAQCFGSATRDANRYSSTAIFGSLISFVGVGHVVNRLIYLIWCNDIKALSLLLGCPIARQRLALGNSHSFVGK
jgi:hypothetical protein